MVILLDFFFLIFMLVLINLLVLLFIFLMMIIAMIIGTTIIISSWNSICAWSVDFHGAALWVNQHGRHHPGPRVVPVLFHA